MYINLNERSLEDVIKLLMADSGIKTKGELGELIGKNPITFRGAINNESIRLVEFLELTTKVGYSVILQRNEADRK